MNANAQFFDCFSSVQNAIVQVAKRQVQKAGQIYERAWSKQRIQYAGNIRKGKD